MSVTDQRLTDQWLLKERTKFWPKNIQPGFVLQDLWTQPWVFGIETKDEVAYQRGEISGEEMMERFRERLRKMGIGVCPHYGLIELCAQFTGITPVELVEEQEFCGLRGEASAMDSLPLPFSFLPGVSLKPEAMCRKVYEKLAGLLAFVEQKRPPELAGQVNLGELSMAELGQLRDAIISYVGRKDAPEEPAQILRAWRESVFAICSIPASELASPDVPLSIREHCRVLTSPDELSEEGVLHRVQLFQDALMNNILGSEKWWNRPAEKCLYAPGHDEGPIVHRDP